MKPPPHSVQNQIVIPLLVMMMLTLIAGGTALYLTWQWEGNYTRLSNNLTQVVLLNNIRWGLSETRDLLEQEPDKARQKWESVQQQARVLGINQNESSASRDTGILVQMLSNDSNMNHIDTILTMPLLSLNLQSIQEDIYRFHSYSRYVSVTMTVTMLVLGGFLMLITARDLSRMMQQLRLSRDQSVRVQEEERRRLAQDLHDEVIQDLIVLQRQVADRPELAAKISTQIETMRRVCHNLKPQILEDLGFSAALDYLLSDLSSNGQTTVDIDLDAALLARIPGEMELPLFRVMQEGIANITRHAEASRVTVAMFSRGPDPQHPAGQLLCRIMDDGRGFEPTRLSDDPFSFGLSGMQERIAQLGGELTVDSKPGKGTSVRFRIPL